MFAQTELLNLHKSGQFPEAGPVPLVMDLRIPHDRVGSSTDPTINGHLKYPNNLDQSLNDAVGDKIRKYRADYNNRPPSAVSFMTAIASTSGRLHSEFVRLLFLQTHINHPVVCLFGTRVGGTRVKMVT